MALLRIEEGLGPPRDIELKGSTFSIGRGSGNDLPIHNRWLSRHHAQIVERDGGHFLSDLGSRNGTFLNGQAIAGEMPLTPGDVIALGDLRIRFLLQLDGVEGFEDRDRPLPASSTVVIRSQDLEFDRYRESEEGTGTAESLLPALNAAASALINYYPIEELTQVVLRLALDAVPAERAALLLRRNGELDIAAVHGFASGEEVRISRTIVRAVVEERQALLTVDARTDDRFGGVDSILLAGIRTLVCAPLWDSHQVIGLLYLDRRLGDRPFGERELRLTGLIANLAAVKIENVRLLEEQIEKKRMAEQLALGAQIQRGLLPSANPDVAGYELCGVNESCYEIGGDYYDFIPREDGRWAIVIADVSGKGVGAALLMAVLQASLRTLVSMASEPGELVHRLNRVLVDSSPANKFATVFYSELDPRAHTLEYVNAGHNAGLLDQGNEVVELGSTGPPVGLIPEAQFTAQRVTLAPGSRLLLYTDGVNEMTDAEGHDFGTQPLVDLLAVKPPLAGCDLVTELRRRLRAFRGEGRGAEDDTTVVSLRRL